MAKAAYWTLTDVEARKRGEQTGLTEVAPECFVRLACVKHAASVHPEPGSNSLIKCLIHSRQPTSLVISCHYCLFIKVLGICIPNGEDGI